MTWKSTQDVIDRFGLDAKPDDFEKLDRELRLKVSQLHPDKNGGQFESSEDRREYDEVKAARDFVSNLMSTSQDVVPIAQLPAIFGALQLAQVNQPNGQARHLRTEVRNENRQDLHSRYTAPRLGSGVFAAITGALFTFSGSLSDHPVLGALESSYEMQLGLLILSGYSVIFFGLTWFFEQRAEAKVDFLLSDQGMQIVFKELVQSIKKETCSLRFSRGRVAKIVSQYCSGSKPVGKLPMLFGRQRVKPSTIDRIVELHVSEWEARGAINKVETPSIERLYDVNQQAIESESDF